MNPRDYTLLILDDDKLVTDALYLHLRRQRYRLLVSNSPKEALQLLEETPVDLIITDFLMPEMNGLEFLIQSKQFCPDATRIILTGYADKENAIRAINEVGLYYYIEKPWENANLDLVIRNGLEKRTYLQELEATNRELEQALTELQATLKKVQLLENIQQHMTKFVPQSVKSIIELNPERPGLEKHERDVSILFLDIAGYTRMSEEMSLDKINYVVERYFSSFLDDIYANGGDVNETAGDGMMILFQDQDAKVHTVQAIRTALAIQQKSRHINEQLVGEHEPVIINIGINSGRASVGTTRIEGISGTRWTYTASGPVTNLAARLGQLAQDGAILIGPETARRIQGSFELKPLGERELKNVKEPVAVFEVQIGGKPNE